jgi:hypothetical protein
VRVPPLFEGTPRAVPDTLVFESSENRPWINERREYIHPRLDSHLGKSS